MCRYAEHRYKDHYACFRCRKMFRQPSVYDLPEHRRPAPGEQRVVACPECRNPMKAMGLDFKAPQQQDVKQWKKVEILFHHGFAFHSCGCSGPGVRPAELGDVEAFLAENRSTTAGERLLRAIAVRGESRRPTRRRPPGEPAREHALTSEVRKLRQPREAAQIAASLLRKRRKSAA